MPEPIDQAAADAAEVITLRKVRDELLTKAAANRARIAELEAAAIVLTETANQATDKLTAVLVTQPVKKMASELSKTVPDLVMRELLDEHTFEAGEDGAIVMKTKADGKPVLGANKEPLPFEKSSLHRYLVGDGVKEKSESQRVFTHLLGIPVGSGGVARKVSAPHGFAGNQAGEKALPAPVFGLK